jgi:hypothetical protein
LAISLSVKDHAQSRQAQPGSAYYPVARQDWGLLAPGTTGTAFSAGANLAASASGGSLPTSTGAFKVTWVTNNGESLPSVEATVSVTGATGSVTVSLATMNQNNGSGSGVTSQTNAAAIIGWNVYSGNGSGNELRNATSAGLTGQALSTLTLPSGATLTYIPIAVTSVIVQLYGAGAAPPVFNGSGVQQSLPNLAGSGTTDIQIKVPVPFNIARPLLWARPNAVADAGGISLDAVDVVAPLWPQSTVISAAQVAAGFFIVIGNQLFQAIVAGTTAASVPNFAASAKFGTVTDNTVTWLNVGRWHLITMRWSNASATPGQPVANEFDFWQP